MEFKTKLYFNSCDGVSPFNEKAYIITLLTEDGDKISCNTDYETYSRFMKKPKFFVLNDISVRLYKYSKGDKAGAYSLIPDLNSVKGD